MAESAIRQNMEDLEKCWKLTPSLDSGYLTVHDVRMLALLSLDTAWFAQDLQKETFIDLSRNLPLDQYSKPLLVFFKKHNKDIFNALRSQSLLPSEIKNRMLFYLYYYQFSGLPLRKNPTTQYYYELKKVSKYPDLLSARETQQVWFWSKLTGEVGIGSESSVSGRPHSGLRFFYGLNYWPVAMRINLFLMYHNLNQPINVSDTNFQAKTEAHLHGFVPEVLFRIYKRRPFEVKLFFSYGRMPATFFLGKDENPAYKPRDFNFDKVNYLNSGIDIAYHILLIGSPYPKPIDGIWEGSLKLGIRVEYAQIQYATYETVNQHNILVGGYLSVHLGRFRKKPPTLSRHYTIYKAAGYDPVY